MQLVQIKSSNYADNEEILYIPGGEEEKGPTMEKFMGVGGTW